MRKTTLIGLFACAAAFSSAVAQGQAQPSGAPGAAGQQDQSSPLYRVTLTARTTKAINYRHSSGSTNVGFQGTVLQPFAQGEAKVEGKKGVVKISTKFEKLQPATKYGPEFLTYVLWAITPEGRAENLGELLLEGGTKAKLDAATELQAFAMVVTAEPYFAVTQPSEVVVMENVVRPDTMGNVEEIDAKFDLLQRSQYTVVTSDGPSNLDPRVPLSLYEARSALKIAVAAGAEKYAGPSLQKAQQLLQQAETELTHKATKKQIDTDAREAVQTAEDARSITAKKVYEAQQEQEKKAAEAREAQARQQAEDAEKAKLEAQLAAERAAREKAEADAAKADAVARQQETQKQADLIAQQKAAAEAESQQARKDADLASQERAAAQADAKQARDAAARAEQEKSDLRARLLNQLNMVLQTRDSVRGLIVNMSDVLFDSGSYILKPGAREKLAKISGILVAYPSLKVQVEGHTDSVGSDEFNQLLSEQRAGAVRDYLIVEGVPSSSVVSRGFGKAQPIATNDTAEGRQQNRRVELVVNGESIGEGSGPGASPTMQRQQ